MLSNSLLGGRCQGRAGAWRLSRLLSRKQENPSLLLCFEYLIQFNLMLIPTQG